MRTTLGKAQRTTALKRHGTPTPEPSTHGNAPTQRGDPRINAPATTSLTASCTVHAVFRAVATETFPAPFSKADVLYVNVHTVKQFPDTCQTLTRSLDYDSTTTDKPVFVVSLAASTRKRGFDARIEPTPLHILCILQLAVFVFGVLHFRSCERARPHRGAKGRLARKRAEKAQQFKSLTVLYKNSLQLIQFPPTRNKSSRSSSSTARFITLSLSQNLSRHNLLHDS